MASGALIITTPLIVMLMMLQSPAPTRPRARCSRARCRWRPPRAPREAPTRRACAARVGGVIEYATEDSLGAILMCDDEVVVELFEVRDPFVRWLKDRQNQAAILKRHRDVRRYGVCVVRGTSSAERIYLRSWSGAGDRVRVGFKLGAAGVGGLKPGVAYYRANHGAGWRRFNGEKRVVFFTGVKFSYNCLGRGREDRRGAAFRGDGGDDFVIEDPDDTGMVYNVTVEEFDRIPADEEDEEVENDGELDDEH